MYATVTVILQDRLQALRLAECENTSLHAVFVCRGDEELKQEYLAAQKEVIAAAYGEESAETDDSYDYFDEYDYMDYLYDQTEDGELDG